MNISRPFHALLSVIVSTVKAITGFLHRIPAKFEDGFHIRRDGRVIYHGRLNPEKFREKGWWKRQERMGCPILTGERLRKILLCCPPKEYKYVKAN